MIAYKHPPIPNLANHNSCLSLQACNNYSKLGLVQKPTLFFEFHCSEQGMEHQTEVAKDIAGYNQGSNFTWALQQEDRSRLWAAR